MSTLEVLSVALVKSAPNKEPNTEDSYQKQANRDKSHGKS